MKLVVQRVKNASVDVDGKIVETGNKKLANKIEKEGYSSFIK